MRSLWFLCALVVAGCECGSGFETVVAPHPSSVDGGSAWSEADGSSLREDLADIPTRCFDDSHTLVVGPWPGCATLEVAGGSGHACGVDGETGETLRGTPVRIVRRGDVLVRLKVLPRCAPSAFGCASESIDLFGDAVYTGLALGPDGRRTELCDRCADGTFRPGSGVAGADLANPDIGFQALEIDDTVELVLMDEDLLFSIVACVVERTPTIEAYLAACYGECAVPVTCPDSQEPQCRARCEDIAALESDACLEARTAAHSCEATSICGAEPADCEAEDLRVEYECRAR